MGNSDLAIKRLPKNVIDDQTKLTAQSRVRPKHIRYRLSADNIGIGRNFGFAEIENPVSVSVSADNLFQYW